jgi:hypothetical protein
LRAFSSLSVIEIIGKTFLFDKEAPNGRRYRQGRDLADKATRRRIAGWGCFPESAGAARTCPVHAVLGGFCICMIPT